MFARTRTFKNQNCKIMLLATMLSALSSAVAYSHTETFRPSDGQPLLLGTGFESARGLVRGSCIVNGPTETLSTVHHGDMICNASGQCSDLEMRVVQNASAFRKALDVSAKASLGIGCFSGDLKASYLNEASGHSSSVFFYVKVTVKNPSQRLSNYIFTDAARQLLEANQGADFLNQCGDSFVVSKSTGGEFIAVLEIETNSEADKRAVSTALSANGLSWGGRASVQLAMESISSNHNIHYKIFRNGAEGALPTNTPAALMAAAFNFPPSVAANTGSPWVNSVTTIDYDAVVGRPGGPLIDLVLQRQFLDRLARDRDVAIDKRNSIDSVLQRPADYLNPDQAALSTHRTSFETILTTIFDATVVAQSSIANWTYPAIAWPQFQLPERKMGYAGPCRITGPTGQID